MPRDVESTGNTKCCTIMLRSISVHECATVRHFIHQPLNRNGVPAVLAHTALLLSVSCVCIRTGKLLSHSNSIQCNFV